LYIGAISTNIEYTETEIYAIETQNQTIVDNVESNPDQMDHADDIWDTAILNHTGDKVIIQEEIAW
jgi:predicted lipoprotein